MSFHSIEDKIIKFFFRNYSENKSRSSRYFPDETINNFALFEKYTNKVIKPEIQEIKKNNPSRSAKLRYAVRSKNKFIYPTDLIKKFHNYLELEKTYV